MNSWKGYESMKTGINVKKNSNKIRNSIILLLIILVITLVGFAYARYVTSLNGDVKAQIATWSFKVDVNNNEFEDDTVIDLASTRIKEKDEANIEDGYIGPGTSGVFKIEVDAKGSDASLSYNMDIDVSKVPENMSFYSDPEMKKKVIVTDNKIQIEDFIGINDENNQKQTKTIYWNWPFESGVSQYEINKNDELDSKWMGKKIELSINVVGKQATEEPLYLADKVEIGDYVDYDASSGEYAEYPAYSGSFTSNDEMKWQVYYIDEVTKTVELISDDKTEKNLFFNSIYHWKNAKTVLNSVGAVYGNGKGAVFGRSINMEDINQYSNYDITTFVNSDGYAYGNVEKYNTGHFTFEDGEEADAGEGKEVSMTQTFYDYSLTTIENTYAKNLLFKSGSYFIASPGVNLLSNGCEFILMWMYSQGKAFSHVTLSYSYCAGSGAIIGVVPIIQMQPNIRTTGKENDVWKLKIE